MPVRYLSIHIANIILYSDKTRRIILIKKSRKINFPALYSMIKIMTLGFPDISNTHPASSYQMQAPQYQILPKTE